MGVALYFACMLLAPWLAPPQPFVIRGGALALLCGGGLVLFMGAARAFGAINLRALRAAFHKE
jgi:hypothetical protein